MAVVIGISLIHRPPTTTKCKMGEEIKPNGKCGKICQEKETWNPDTNTCSPSGCQPPKSEKCGKICMDPIKFKCVNGLPCALADVKQSGGHDICSPSKCPTGEEIKPNGKCGAICHGPETWDPTTNTCIFVSDKCPSGTFRWKDGKCYTDCPNPNDECGLKCIDRTKFQCINDVPCDLANVKKSDGKYVCSPSGCQPPQSGKCGEHCYNPTSQACYKDTVYPKSAFCGPGLYCKSNEICDKDTQSCMKCDGGVLCGHGCMDSKKFKCIKDLPCDLANVKKSEGRDVCCPLAHQCGPNCCPGGCAEEAKGICTKLPDRWTYSGEQLICRTDPNGEYSTYDECETGILKCISRVRDAANEIQWWNTCKGEGVPKGFKIGRANCRDMSRNNCNCAKAKLPLDRYDTYNMVGEVTCPNGYSVQDIQDDCSKGDVPYGAPFLICN